MKFIFLFLCLIFTLKKSYSQNIEAKNSTCNMINCPMAYGECINDICLCGAGYTTIVNDLSKNDPQFCNYDYKYKDSAAYFEAMMPFGVGHFYAHRFLHAIIKWFLFLFLSLSKIMFRKEIKLSPILEKANSYLFWVFVIFYVIDYIGFTFSFYLDGNGMDLI
jgi:hypothetical protein